MSRNFRRIFDKCLEYLRIFYLKYIASQMSRNFRRIFDKCLEYLRIFYLKYIASQMCRNFRRIFDKIYAATGYTSRSLSSCSVTVTTIDLRGPNRRVPSTFRSSPGLLLPPPLTRCHRAAHKRLLLTPLTGAFFLPPLTGAFFLPLLTGPLLLPPLTTSCSLVVVCFSKRQTKLIQDENQLLENILRMLLQELAAAFQSGEKTMQHGESIDDGENTHGQLPRLLDIVLYLCENEHIEGEMIFQLLEDLTEMSTMKNCEDVFGYIESKQHILGKPELFARGKLVMLRTCNQLLRRLSNGILFKCAKYPSIMKNRL
ncbi:hypothetical protein R6Q59_002190 [Mikania micrantha]